MNLTLFDFPLEVRKQIKGDTELGREIKKNLDRWELIETEILQKFFRLKLLKLDDGDILLSGFPNTVDQFETLSALSEKSHLTIKMIWHINFQIFKNLERLKTNEESNAWSEKFGGEITDKLSKDFENWKRSIADIFKSNSHFKWHAFEISSENELQEKLINFYQGYV